MALTATSVCEIRNGGDDANGGWFDPSFGGTDHTLNASPYRNLLFLAGNGTDVITDAGNNFDSSVVGNCLRVAGQGLYQITEFIGVGSVRVDRTTGTFSGTTGKLGGALATIGQFGADIAAVGTTQNGTYIKADATVSITTTTANVSGGALSFASVDLGFIVGYDTDRSLWNTDTARPTILAQVANMTGGAINPNGQDLWILRNLILDGNRSSYSNNRMITGTSGRGMLVENCKVKSCSSYPAQASAIWVRCEFTDNTLPSQSHGCYYACEFHDNPTNVSCLSLLQNAGWFEVDSCLFYNNTGTGACIALAGTAQTILIRNCVFYNNPVADISFTNNYSQAWIENNIFVGTPTGVLANSAHTNCRLRNNFYYNNATAQVHSNIPSSARLGEVSLTGSPFVDAASGNFALNDTPGAGAAVRNAGYGAFPRGLTTGYPDGGAAQHQEVGGGGGGGLLIHPGMGGGLRG